MTESNSASRPAIGAPLQGFPVHGGRASGVALVTDQCLSFNLGVDERSGVVIEPGHPLQGQSVAGKILVYRGGKGSTASSFSLLQLVALGCGPLALVVTEADAITVAGAVLSAIPLVHGFPVDPTAAIRTGDVIVVDGDTGIVQHLQNSGDA